MSVKVFCTGGIGNCLYHIAAGRYLRDKGYDVEFINRCAHSGTSNFINKFEELKRTDDTCNFRKKHITTIDELERCVEKTHTVYRWCFLPCLHYYVPIHVDTDNCIGIHIRRGDFLDAKYKDRPAMYNLCDSVYYNNVYSVCATLNLPVKIFTDDPSTIPSGIQNLFDCSIISNNPESDFYELASCKYKFISNSTFSIWAGYVNNQSTVFYPKGLVDRLMLTEWNPISIC